MFKLMKHQKMQVGMIALILALLTSGSARGQEPLSDEFRVNTYTEGLQIGPTIAVDGNGDFIITWSPGDVCGYGLCDSIYAQRYDKNQAPIGEEFRVSDPLGDKRILSDVAATSDGSFAVVWRELAEYSSDVFGRFFHATGEPASSAFRLNSYTDTSPNTAHITATSDDRYIVIWLDIAGWGSIHGSRWTADGASIGDEFIVDHTVYGISCAPLTVAGGPDGGFLVSWFEFLSWPDGPHVVKARLYDSAGQAGDTFQVNTYDADITPVPVNPPGIVVAAGNDEGYLVVWHSRVGPPEGQRDIRAQRYDGNGNAIGKETTLRTINWHGYSHMSVSMDEAGNATLVWVDYDGEKHVYGQRFSKELTPLGDPFSLSESFDGKEERPDVATAPDGDIVATWHRGVDDDMDIYARVFDVPQPEIEFETWPSPVKVYHLFNFIYFGVLSDDDFDALSIDPSSVRLGPSSGAPIWNVPYDIDADGDLDLTLVFNVSPTGINCYQDSANLTGALQDGRVFDVTLPLRHIGCRRWWRR